MKTCIHVATQFEAFRIISLLNLKRTRLPGLSHCYQNNEQEILMWISGIGCAATQKSIAHLFSKTEIESANSRWINIGTAGANDTNIAVGELYSVSQIVRESLTGQNEEPILLSQPLASVLPKATLKTVDEPATTVPAQKETESKEEPTLFDMEAYHWANDLALNNKIPLSNVECYKIVSDHADGQKIDFQKFALHYDSAINDLFEGLHLVSTKYSEKGR